MDTLISSKTRLFCFLFLAAGLISAAAAQIPQPSLDGVEPALAEQITDAQQLIEESEGQGLSEQSEAWGELGMLYQALEYDDEALQAYRRAQSIQPLDGRWPYLVGIILAARGETEAARLHFTAAMALMPSQTTAAWIRIARVFLDAGRAEQALLAAEQALARNQDSASALAVKGEALLALDQAQAAVEALQGALAIEPRANRLRFPLGMAYRSLGETDAMERELALAGQIGLSPDDPVGEYLQEHARGSRILLLRGRRAFLAEDFESALALFERSSVTDPDNPEAWANLGATQALLGDSSAAIASLRRSLDLDPDQQRTRINLAEILSAQGEIDRAWRLLNEDEATLGSFESLVTRARLARQLSNLEAAAGDYLAALDLEKDLGVWREAIDVLMGLDRFTDIEELATHSGLNAEGRAAVAVVIRRLISSETASLPALALTIRLSEHLYAVDDSLIHLQLVIQARLAQQPDCRSTIQWLMQQIEGNDDWPAAKARAAQQLVFDLARQPRCQAKD